MNGLKHRFFGTRKRLVATLVTLLIGLYALVGFLVVPQLARPRIEEAITTMTDRETRLEKLRFNPFTLSATVIDFEMTDTDGDKLLSLSRAHANLQLLSLILFREFHFKEVDLTDPFARIEIESDRSLNIADILNQMTGSGAVSGEEDGGRASHLKIDLLRVENGSFIFADYSLATHFTTEVSPISFDVTRFHTSGQSDAPYAFTAQTETGESIQWEGYVALAPFRSGGSFVLQGLSMPKYDPFNDLFVRTDIIDGTVDVSGDYTYTSGGDGLIQLENGNVKVSGVSVVKESDQGEVLKLAHGEVTGLGFTYPALDVTVDTVSLSEGSLTAIRLPGGQVDLLDLLDPAVMAKSGKPELEEKNDQVLDYRVNQIELANFSLQFIDQVLPEPASLGVDALQVTLNNLANTPETVMEVDVSANLRTGGSFSGKGTATLGPLGAEMDLAISALELRAGNPYLSELSHAWFESGQFELHGRAVFSMGEVIETGFTGTIGLKALNLIERTTGEDLARIAGMTVNEITYTSHPAGLTIGAIVLDEPKAVLQIAADGSTNLSRAFPSQEEETQPGEPVEPTTGLNLPFPVAIGSITLEGAGAILSDQSVSPPANLGIASLSGTIAGLSSEELARADLNLQGTLVGGTQLEIVGQINPLIADRYSDVAIRFNDFNLTAVSPYAGKYAGYALNKGKLSFDLEYRISHAELSGENVLIIDQLTLGERVESEDAVNLPIPLAVSLLKDRNGIIEIDVPVTGNLNDPDFGFGRVIGRALVNVLTKLVTSPFSMLGNLVPGGADLDLSQVALVPGGEQPDEAAIEKLNLLAKALTERPSLSLEIVGGAGGPDELQALRAAQLETTIRTAHWNALREAGDDQTTLEAIVLTPADRQRLITTVFQTRFPDATPPAMEPALPPDPGDVSAEPEIPSAVPAAEESVAEKGPIRRFINRIFGKEAAEEIPPVEEAETAYVPSPVTGWSIAEMESRLLEAIEISEAELVQLADARAEAVRHHLESVDGIAPERLFIARSDDSSLVNADSGIPRVVFNLE